MNHSDPLIGFLDGEARALGFDSMGIVAAEAPEDDAHQIERQENALKQFVDAGWHGSMGWMADTMERRSRPKALWPDARSIIMLSMNYGPETDPLSILHHPDKGAISVYARHRDYHDVMKGRLKTLASKLVAHTKGSGRDCDVKVFVDTAPVMEKPLAHRAGLGWQGKHTNLVSRQYGSWLFLGSIFTTLDLTADESETDHCGSCQSCLDICPTNAFPAPYKLDARRCISYLTIEHKGPIPLEFRKAMGNRVYGCDDCLAICPWNKFAIAATESKLSQPDNVSSPMIKVFLGFDDSAFRTRFTGSPVKRIGRNRFIRNCLIAAGNSKNLSLVAPVKALQTDPDPVVSEAAHWALGELMKEAR